MREGHNQPNEFLAVKWNASSSRLVVRDVMPQKCNLLMFIHSRSPDPIDMPTPCSSYTLLPFFVFASKSPSSPLSFFFVKNFVTSNPRYDTRCA